MEEIRNLRTRRRLTRESRGTESPAALNTDLNLGDYKPESTMNSSSSFSTLDSPTPYNLYNVQDHDAGDLATSHRNLDDNNDIGREANQSMSSNPHDSFLTSDTGEDYTHHGEDGSKSTSYDPVATSGSPGTPASVDPPGSSASWPFEGSNDQDDESETNDDIQEQSWALRVLSNLNGKLALNLVESLGVKRPSFAINESNEEGEVSE